MELRPFLVSLLFILLISAYADARKSISGSRRRGGSSVYRPRSTSAPRVTHPPQTHVSEKQKGQEYRNWAAKLTGAGNEQKPKLSGTTSQQHQGSNPNKIGWNVPPASQKQNSPSSSPAKPSAPLPDHNVATKVNAPNVQSGYNPSGNTYGHNPSQSYNPSVGHGYNPPVGGQSYNQPYNPSVGQSYNPSFGHPHNPAGGNPYSPAGGHGYNPSYNQGYNPSVGQSYNPPSYGQIYHPPAGQGYNPPVGQSIVVVPGQTGQSYRPGIGQLAKEALVFAGVSAGVNAAVNRLLPGGGHSGGGSSGGGGVTHTQITYNNYYNNQSDSQGSNAPAAAPGAAPAAVPAAAPAVPQPNPAIPVDPNASSTSTAAPVPNAASSNAQASAAANQNTAANSNSNDQNAQGNTMTNASPTGNIITDEDIQKLSEDLLTKDKNNANQYITLNLQGKKVDDSVTDDAPEPLLTVKPEALEIPTVKAIRSLFDNYELDVKVKENVTPEKRKEEMELLDAFLATDVLSSAMKFLADKGYIPNDEYEYKDALKRIWFSQFKRGDGEPSSSGFETVYLAEKFDSDIIGLHDWIYFNDQETAKKLNYLGYIKDVGLGDKGAIVKLRDSLNDIVQPVTTIFVGTSPELEMALYTVCFYTRPNGPCPVSLGGNKFVIIAHRFNYFGKDILVSAYPEI